MTPSDTPKTLSKSLQAQEKPNLTVVKVGGAIVEDERQLTQLLQDFSAISGYKVLVHGGGRRATKVAKALGKRVGELKVFVQTKTCLKWLQWCMADW